MLKLAFALAGAALAPFAAHAADRAFAFDREGHHYVGTISQSADGSQLIAGRDDTAKTAFALRVRNGYVTGLIDGQPVSYAVPRKAAMVTPVALTSND